MDSYTINQMLKKAFDDAAIGVALVGLNGRWLMVNNSLCSMLGYAAEELLRTDFQSLTHQDDLTEDLAKASALRSGHLRVYRTEKRYFHKSGKIIWVLLTGSVVRKMDGTPDFFVAQIQDITAQKNDAAARDALFELSHNLLAIADSKLALKQVNARWRVASDLKPAELVGRNLLSLIHRDDAERLRRAIEATRVGEPREPVLARLSADRASGRFFELRMALDRLGNLFIEGQDVTAYKKERDIQAGIASMLKDIADNVPAVIGFFDSQQRNVYASGQYEHWFGLKPEQLRGMHIRDILGYDIYDRESDMIAEVLQGVPQVMRGTLPAGPGRPELSYVVHLTPAQRNGSVHGYYVLALEEKRERQAA